MDNKESSSKKVDLDLKSILGSSTSPKSSRPYNVIAPPLTGKITHKKGDRQWVASC